MIPAIRRRCSKSFWRWRIIRPCALAAEPSCGGKTFSWASASPASSTKPAPGRAPISPCAAACTAAGRTRSCACTPTARSPCSPAVTPTARATTSPLRRSPPTGSRSISTTSAWSRATPIAFRSVTAPGARVRCRSPAPRSTGRRTASSSRRGRSPPRRWNAQSRTSSMSAIGSGCTAPIAASALRPSPTSPITAPNSAITDRPASKSPSSTIRPTPTIRRRCISPW